MFPVSLKYQFSTAPSIFSNVYFQIKMTRNSNKHIAASSKVKCSEYIQIINQNSKNQCLFPINYIYCKNPIVSFNI